MNRRRMRTPRAGGRDLRARGHPARQRRVRALGDQTGRRVPGRRRRVHAIGNHDPASDANVLSRGIVGDIGGELVVASPMYKQHFSLLTGRCLEEPAYCGPRLSGACVDGQIWVRAQPCCNAQRRGASAGWS